MVWVRFGSIGMFLAVALGAFGAHALRQRLSPEMLSVFETGVRYQVYHALALFAVAWLAERHPGSLVEASGWSFTVGIVIFSGSLYLLSATGVRWLGAITPIGGLAFLAGWLLLFMASIR
jgi:uncharacterized membrane protein YgdD (TMEM256/DUF423 family)